MGWEGRRRDRTGQTHYSPPKIDVSIQVRKITSNVSVYYLTLLRHFKVTDYGTNA